MLVSSSPATLDIKVSFPSFDYHIISVNLATWPQASMLVSWDDKLPLADMRRNISTAIMRLRCRIAVSIRTSRYAVNVCLHG